MKKKPSWFDIAYLHLPSPPFLCPWPWPSSNHLLLVGPLSGKITSISPSGLPWTLGVTSILLHKDFWYKRFCIPGCMGRSCRLKNIHDLKVESYIFYLVGVFRAASLGDNVSVAPERTALRRGGEEPGYIEVLQQRADSMNIKILMLMKENQISQVKQFSTFLCRGRWESLGSLKYMHLSCLGPVPYFLILIFLSWGLTIGSGCSLMAATWQVFFPSWVFSGLTRSFLTVAAIAGDYDIPVSWYGGK